jgi:hypothetical protein
MRIKISAGRHVLYLAELVTLFRCEGFRGRADLGGIRGVDELIVELELGDRDLVLNAHGFLPVALGKAGAKRRLEISTPATLPTDELDD